jgi:hypothetical protein
MRAAVLERQRELASQVLVLAPRRRVCPPANSRTVFDEIRVVEVDDLPWFLRP